MKTSELIQALSSEPKPRSRVVPLGIFLGYWSLGVAVLFAAAFSYWSMRPDWAAKLQDPWFFFETLLLFMIASGGAIMVYRSAIPSLLKRSDLKWAILPIGMITGLWLAKFHSGIVPLPVEFHGEMNAYRGRCGALILAVGSLAGAGMFIWARRAAPTRLRLTGLWIALSSGSLGTLAMQAVCPYENPLHLWIWHVFPVIALAGLSSYLAEPLLRWAPRVTVAKKA
jgi:hypothetical protein